MRLIQILGPVIAAITAAAEEQMVLTNGALGAVAPLNVAIIGMQSDQ